MSVEKQTSLADAFRDELSKTGPAPPPRHAWIAELVSRADQGDSDAVNQLVCLEEVLGRELAPKPERPLAWLADLMQRTVEKGDPADSKVLIQVGLAVTQTLEIAARLHAEVAEQAKSSFLYPICISAFEAEAEEMFRFWREDVGLGGKCGLKVRKGSGRLAFEGIDSGSFVARHLFLVMESARNKTFTAEKKNTIKRKMQTYLDAPQRLHLDVWALSELEGRKFSGKESASEGNAVVWAEVGAKLMVDGCRFISGIPEIPAKWRGAANKAKKGSPKGRLRDAVRKRLEKGFESIAPN